MRENYENWWSKNIFSENSSYIHDGKEHTTPSVEEFSKQWMGTVDSIDRKEVRGYITKYNSVLDVGCGGAPEYYGLKDISNIKYTGLDITPELVQLNKNNNIECHVGSANDIKFKDSSFEVVHSRHVIEHMSNFQKPISEFIRVAEKLVLVVFFIGPFLKFKSEINLDNKGTDGEIYHNRYSRFEIRNFLNKIEKVNSYEYVKLGGISTYLLKIKLK